MSEASMPHCPVCRRVEYDCACKGSDEYEDGIPGIVSEAIRAMGNLPSELSDDEWQGACTVALDAIVRGRESAIGEVQNVLRGYAAEHGWTDWILDPVTGRYPWEGEVNK